MISKITSDDVEADHVESTIVYCVSKRAAMP